MNLQNIDLGKDEAEQDQRLKEYFLKTTSYQNALLGTKTIVIGRKGSGKSAIFTLMRSELEKAGTLVIPITPDQYSWSALRDYQEQGILPEQAHTNAWKFTLLSAIVWRLNEDGLVASGSKLVKYYQMMRDSFVPKKEDWFLGIVNQWYQGFCDRSEDSMGFVRLGGDGCRSHTVESDRRSQGIASEGLATRQTSTNPA